MYIPLNKIKTNLYSDGRGVENPNKKEGTSPLINSTTGEVYIGYYWKDYKGKYYTGKNPNDKPTIELIFELPQLTPTDTRSQITAINQPNYPFFGEGEVPYNESLVENYTRLNGIDTKKIKFLPTSYYPQPTEEDYNLGVFTRYFCVKANEDIYLEISKDTYNALNNQKGDWMWQLYTPFQILWTISGEEKEVEKTNYNMTIIQEKRLKRRGLTQFLRNNYLKFYPSPYTAEDVALPSTEIPIKKDKPSIKDLFTITKPKLAITLKEIENAKTATPAVTSSIGNPLTGIRVDTSFEDSKSDQRRTN